MYGYIILGIAIGVICTFIGYFISRNRIDWVGFLYVDVGDKPEQVYLQLTIDVNELKKMDYVTLKVDEINSHQKHSI